jgi:hypothetical protein
VQTPAEVIFIYQPVCRPSGSRALQNSAPQLKKLLFGAFKLTPHYDADHPISLAPQPQPTIVRVWPSLTAGAPLNHHPLLLSIPINSTAVSSN